MAFPSDETLSDDRVRTIFARSRQLRQAAVQYIAQCDAGAIDLQGIAMSFLVSLLGPIKVELVAIAASPDIFTALQRQKPTIWATAAAAQTDYEAAQAAITTMITFLEGNIPLEAVTRRLLVLVLSNDGSGTVTPRTITNAPSIASFRAQLVTFRDAFVP